MGVNCDKCRSKLKDTIVICDGLCKNSFHPECVDLTDQDWKVISGVTNAKWFCNHCLVYMDSNLKIGQNISEIKKMVEEKISNIEEIVSGSNKFDHNLKSKSYAKAAGEVLIIKPRQKQESNVTKEAIKKSFSPARLEVGIAEMKGLKEGGILIKCNSKDDVEKVKSATEKKLKRNYDIKFQEQRNPKIKIVGMEEEMDKETVENMIRKQNAHIIKENHQLDIKVIRKMKTRYMAIAECDPTSFGSIMENGKLCIGWSMCSVYEYVPVFRCYKCGNFDHKANECTAEDRCLHCTTVSHNTGDCHSDQYKCFNCVSMNEKFKLNLKVDHNIFDINCPVYRKKGEAKKKYIKMSPGNDK